MQSSRKDESNESEIRSRRAGESTQEAFRVDSLNYTEKRKPCCWKARRGQARSRTISNDLDRPAIHDMNIDGAVFPRRKRGSSRYSKKREAYRGAGEAEEAFQKSGSRCIRANEKKIAARRKNRVSSFTAKLITFLRFPPLAHFLVNSLALSFAIFASNSRRFDQSMNKSVSGPRRSSSLYDSPRFLIQRADFMPILCRFLN